MFQIIVTGASGMLGRSIIKDVVQLNSDNSIFTYHSQRTNLSIYQNIKNIHVIKYDLENPNSLLDLLNPNLPVLVLHFACTSSNNINEAYRVDFLGTCKFIRQLKKALNKTIIFVFASSIAVQNHCNYGLIKSMIEEELMNSSEENFFSICVRIPFVRPQNAGEYYNIPLESFHEVFLKSLNFKEMIQLLNDNTAKASSHLFTNKIIDLKY